MLGLLLLPLELNPFFGDCDGLVASLNISGADVQVEVCACVRVCGKKEDGGGL